MKYRILINIKGAVQGVGFRPFIHRLAIAHNLSGWVKNSPQGVTIEAEGERNALETFIEKIEIEKPEISFIKSLNYITLQQCTGFGKNGMRNDWLPGGGSDVPGICQIDSGEKENQIKISKQDKNIFSGESSFKILPSDTDGEPSAYILPDIATCKDCITDIFDTKNRRYFYPFTNCTNCGPRFTIIDNLPYDRNLTVMKDFKMCSDCSHEYEESSDRRFHAQPNACGKCGPGIYIYDNRKNQMFNEIHDNKFILEKIAEYICNGCIIALKGIGGFHLIADATNIESVKLLRLRKHREEKPFAVMFPDINSIKDYCILTSAEEKLLTSPQSPVVLLQIKENNNSPKIHCIHESSGNKFLGAMLPYTPLHKLLLNVLNKPVIATSGNISDDPICFTDNDAFSKLGNIADFFLIHDRKINRYADDSIARFINNRQLILRRSRGYAPLPVRLNFKTDKIVLAVGGHLKNTVAVNRGEEVFISQHIGDLETKESYAAFERIIDDLLKMYNLKPDMIVSDLHPDYLSTAYAKIFAEHNNIQHIKLQHHIAHIYSVLALNETEYPCLGLSFDGTGMGSDNTVWGGEFFNVSENEINRIGSFKKFMLPGGESSLKDIRKIAAAMLWEIGLDKELQDMTGNDYDVIKTMLEQRINTPYTTSLGRIFDAVAFLTGIRNVSSFEGQAAMELEFSAMESQHKDSYNLNEVQGKIDWSEMIKQIIIENGKKPKEYIARKFHNSIVRAVTDYAKQRSYKNVIISGGCFQNSILFESICSELTAENINVIYNDTVPINDGGISLGQVYYALKLNM